MKEELNMNVKKLSDRIDPNEKVEDYSLPTAKKTDMKAQMQTSRWNSSTTHIGNITDYLVRGYLPDKNSTTY